MKKINSQFLHKLKDNDQMNSINIYCSNCSTTFSQSSSENYIINTLKKIGLFQCPICLFVDNMLIIQDFHNECMICFENNSNKIIYDCHHWICNSCYDNKINKKHCPYCRQTTETKRSIFKNASNISFPEPFKPFYSKLYIRISDFIDWYIHTDNIYDKHSHIIQLLNEYHKWLTLVGEYGAQKLSPSPLIDKVWHCHILDTINYRLICDQICGKFIDHFPENAFFSNYEKKLERMKLTRQHYTEKYGDIKMQYWDFPKFSMHLHTFESDGYIFVKTLYDKIITLPYVKTMHINDIKIMLEDIENIPVETQRLIFAGIQLEEDNRDLIYYNIRQSSTLHVVERLRGC